MISAALRGVWPWWVAAHSDDALALLSAPSPEERSALRAVRCQSNPAILHADASVMPKSRKCRASWVYTEPAGAQVDKCSIRADRIGIWIDYTTGPGGLIATLTGRRVPLTNRALLAACLRRPFGSRRVLALIHWQALERDGFSWNQEHRKTRSSPCERQRFPIPS